MSILTSPSNEILLLDPVFHEKIWGGRTMERVFGYDMPSGKIGECWAIAGHANGTSTVRSGDYAGKTIRELWDTDRKLFGNLEGSTFPLLIKVLDAREDLSVQVHPDDAYANEHEDGSLGKRECWYVLDAEPGTKIIVGQKAKNAEEFRARVEAGEWDELLSQVDIHAGDFFAIEPGCVHAIKGGTMVLETQQSSDVTYRVYDYDRTDDEGNHRELHLKQALDVIDYSMEAPTDGRVTGPEVNGITYLMSCPNFDVIRVRLTEGGTVTLPQEHPFMCLSVVSGSGQVTTDFETTAINAGDHFLVTSNATKVELTGQMELICSWPPSE